MLRARPEGPRAGEGFLSGGGVLWEGQRAPSPPARGSGERCELPQRGPGGASENFEFDAFWHLKIASKLCKMMVFVN